MQTLSSWSLVTVHFYCLKISMNISVCDISRFSTDGSLDIFHFWMSAFEYVRLYKECCDLWIKPFPTITSVNWFFINAFVNWSSEKMIYYKKCQLTLNFLAVGFLMKVKTKSEGIREGVNIVRVIRTNNATPRYVGKYWFFWQCDIKHVKIK